MARIALCDEHRAAFASRLDHEPVTVDDAHTALDRIDAEADPREIEERQRRHHRDVDPRIGEEQFHRVLGDEWRAGHRVEHGARCDRSGDEALDDGRIHLVHHRCGLVDIVEARGVDDCGRRRMAPGAHESDRGGLDGAQRAGGEEVGVAGTETDHHDARSVGHEPYWVAEFAAVGPLFSEVVSMELVAGMAPAGATMVPVWTWNCP